VCHKFKFHCARFCTQYLKQLCTEKKRQSKQSGCNQQVSLSLSRNDKTSSSYFPRFRIEFLVKISRFKFDSYSTSTLSTIISFSAHPFAISTLLTQETLCPSCTADFALRCTIEFLSSLTLFLSTGGELSVETGTQTCSQVPPLPP